MKKKRKGRKGKKGQRGVPRKFLTTLGVGPPKTHSTLHPKLNPIRDVLGESVENLELRRKKIQKMYIQNIENIFEIESLPNEKEVRSEIELFWVKLVMTKLVVISKER